MSISYVRPRPVVRHAGPVRRCPACRSVLDGGPVLFRCPRCEHAVHAADVPAEVGANPPRPAA
ncbi:hypothetical protein [Actinomadura fibrosa]|uniref:Uncharacterized protein n=1 Tax=Actinomadura fibrosa TaxID=111802 RepID=A0ABW2XNG5_9ACTN|nr:hypothetical protein [Actinomadura fibrosa]